MKDVYDNIYSKYSTYNGEITDKINLILSQLDGIPLSSRIVDIGCGKGHYLRALKNHGYTNVLGVEFSEVCCNQYLTDLPHIESNIITYLTTTKVHFDFCICMDVLEHLSKSDVEVAIKGIVDKSTTSIIGIANHSDVFDGVELHLIQQDSDWWYNLLSQYTKHVTLLQPGNQFFVFKISNE